MAKVLVIFDIHDPEGQFEGEENEQNLMDLENWLREDIVDSTYIETMPFKTGVPLKIYAESMRLISIEDFNRSNRSTWQKGASN